MHLLAQPGDALLYSTNDQVDYGIELKTGGPVAHIEIYEGNEFSLASRNGVGVNRYSYRVDGLTAILRPMGVLDIEAATAWFETVKGEAYDWEGLFNFYRVDNKPTPSKLFCSSFATLWYRQTGIVPFAPEWPADKISPRDFLTSPTFQWIWHGFTL